jgi:hypothetical protein
MEKLKLNLNLNLNLKFIINNHNFKGFEINKVKFE